MRPDLKVKLGPLELSNPVMTASGTFGYGVELSDEVDPSLLGAIITKGLSLKPREGNPTPRIAETPAGMLNAIGLQNIGVESFLKNKLPMLKKAGAVVIVNIFGETEDEYKTLAEILSKEDGVSGLEINLSCPNVKKGGMIFGTNPDFVRRITESVKTSFDGFVMVKLTPNVTDIGELAIAAEDGGADAVSCINTLRGMAVDPFSKRPLLATVTGGLSGPAIRPVALAACRDVLKRVKIPVAGVGGIISARDAMEFFVTGVSAVQIGTATFLDARAPLNIIAELKETLVKMGYNSISEIIGTLREN